MHLKTKKILSFIFLLAIVGIVLSPSLCLAGAKDEMIKNLSDTGLASGQENVKNDPITITISLVNTALGLVGLIAVVFIIYAGFLWMTAHGSSEQIEKAQGTLKNATIGLAIILLARAISWFVVDQISKASSQIVE